MEMSESPSALWNVVTVLKSIEKGRIDTCATCKNGGAEPLNAQILVHVPNK